MLFYQEQWTGEKKKKKALKAPWEGCKSLGHQYDKELTLTFFLQDFHRRWFVLLLA